MANNLIIRIYIIGKSHCFYTSWLRDTFSSDFVRKITTQYVNIALVNINETDKIKVQFAS